METVTNVLHQRCCLTIDTATASISGFVEVTVNVSEGQANVNLHAQNLKIHSVMYNNAPLAWGLSEPCLVPMPEEWRKNQVKDSAADLAKMAFLQFKHIRECTLRPSLCIKLPAIVESTASKQITIKIDYSVDQPAGFRFVDDYGFVRNDGFDGASSWMPCNQTNARNTTFEFEITVPSYQLVICSGKLTAVTRDEAKTHKTYRYKVSGLTCLWRLCLCVGEFDTHDCTARATNGDDRQSSPQTHISCFGPKESSESMAYTMKFFPPLFSFVEEVLATSFPFENLKILFLPDLLPVASGCYECIMLSTTLLLKDHRSMDHGLHHRLQICSGLVRVWFGAIVVQKSPADQWLLEGLIGWMQRKITIRLVGANEFNYRRGQEHKLLCDADNGSLPPLYPKDGIHEMLGIEWYHCRELLRWKSTSVMCMIEQRVSHEAFKRVVERLVACACQSGAPSTKRLISTKPFLKEIGQAGGIKKEIMAFAERWIYGNGCPTIKTEVGFDSKTFSLLLSIKQEGSGSCMEATAKAVKMSKDGSIGLMTVTVAETTSIVSHTVQLGAETSRDARFKLTGRPRKRRRMESTVSITENQSPVKWVRFNSDYAMLAVIQTKQTEEMWSAMLEGSKDIMAESEAINGLLSLESGSIGICKTLQAFIKSAHYCRVRMEAILALAQLSSQENAYEGLRFLTEFYRSRRFNPETTLPKANVFSDLSELLVDQTIAVALGSMRDADGRTPKEAVNVILAALEYNNNEGNDFDDFDWIAALFGGLEKVVVEEEAEWKPIFAVIERYLARDRLFPSKNQIVTQACLSALGSATLRQSFSFRLKMLPFVAKFVDPSLYQPKTRAIAGQEVTKISASIYGPDKALFNALHWCMQETSAHLCEAMFRKMMALIQLLGAKARGKHGIQWQTVELLYNALLNPTLNGAFRHDCLLMLLTIADESAALYRQPTNWILANPPEATSTHSGADSQATKKVKFKIN